MVTTLGMKPWLRHQPVGRQWPHRVNLTPQLKPNAQQVLKRDPLGSVTAGATHRHRGAALNQELLVALLSSCSGRKLFIAMGPDWRWPWKQTAQVGRGWADRPAAPSGSDAALGIPARQEEVHPDP
ncbi:unnamed protein product [Rangifer tarandus platyrhynchus]|uniref:Uncharacterized protein n=1 Tax=Rangifer tarandus platyrhynchus TaxID=3082113 RepID=A0AC59YAZ8_RANTA